MAYNCLLLSYWLSQRGIILMRWVIGLAMMLAPSPRNLASMLSTPVASETLISFRYSSTSFSATSVNSKLFSYIPWLDKNCDICLENWQCQKEACLQYYKTNYWNSKLFIKTNSIVFRPMLKLLPAFFIGNPKMFRVDHSFFKENLFSFIWF